MAFSGKIEDLPVLDIFQYLNAGKKTGTLILSRQEETAYVYFQNGEIVHAVSPQKSNIGYLLVERQEITLKVLQQALVLQNGKCKGKPVGQILVELNAISPQGLRTAVVEQIRQVIRYLIGWKEGEFNFCPNEIAPVDDITLNPISDLSVSKLNTPMLLMEAVDGAAPNPPAASSVPERSQSAPPRVRVAAVSEAVRPAPKPAESRLNAETETARNCPVLLLTDDGFLRNLLRDHLRQKKIDVTAVTLLNDCFKKAEEFIGKNEPPFLLLDENPVGLPKFRQRACAILAREIERLKGEAPAVVMMQAMDIGLISELYRSGVTGVLPKPIRGKENDQDYPELVRCLSGVILAQIRQFNRVPV